MQINTNLLNNNFKQHDRKELHIGGDEINISEKEKGEADRKTIDATGLQANEPESFSARKKQAQSEAFKISLEVFRDDMRADEKKQRLKVDSARHSEDARYYQQMERTGAENFETIREMYPEDKETIDALVHAYDIFSRPQKSNTEYKGFMRSDTLEEILAKYALAKPKSGETIYGESVSTDDIKNELSDFNKYVSDVGNRRNGTDQNSTGYYTELNEDNIKFQPYGYQALYKDYGDELSFNEIERLIGVGMFGMSDSVRDAIDRYGAEKSFHNQAVDSLYESKLDDISLKSAARQKLKSHLMSDAAGIADNIVHAANKEVVESAFSESINMLDEKSGEIEAKSKEQAVNEGANISSEEHARNRIAKLASSMGLALEDIKGSMIDDLR